MRELKIKGHEGLVRDVQTNAIISNEDDQLKTYRLQKALKLKEVQRDKEISLLKNEVKDLKAIMLEVLEKIQNNK